MKAMILAAGEGTRLRPFTLHLPKPAIPFLGVPLIDYGLHLLNEMGNFELVVNHHHLSGEIRKLFHRPGFHHRRVDFSDEDSLLLGSGGGIHKAQPFLEKEKHFVVLNGDEVILPLQNGQLRKAWQEHQQSDALATLIVMENPDVGTKFGGAWCAADHRVKAFSKTPVDGLKGWHYVGIIFLSNRIFKWFKNEIVEENLLYDNLTKAMQAGESVRIAPIETKWFETGNPTDFLHATEVCLDALLVDHPVSWAQELYSFLSTRVLHEPLIEEKETLLVHKMEQLRKKFEKS